MPDAGTIIGWLVAIGSSGGLMFFLTKRWIERPRLRVKLRQDGLIGNDRHLVFEIANAGERATSLRPVVRMRALVPKHGRRYWYPGILGRLMTEEQVLRRYLCVPLHRPFSGHIDERYDIVEEHDLRLEAHCGAQTMRARPRYPSRIHPLVVFRIYEFRREGKCMSGTSVGYASARRE